MFKDFSKSVHAQFTKMSKDELFVVEVPEIFEKYLSFFPAGTDPIYKKRTEHDCNCCKRFIRNIGRLVSIKDGKIVTVWDDFKSLPRPYNIVSEKMGELVHSYKIKTVFRTKERKFGVDHNYDAEKIRHDHFYGEIADRHYHKIKAETLRGEQEAIYQVMKRGLEEIQEGHISDVIDLIDNNGLYRGQEHLEAIGGFMNLLRCYNGAKDKEIFIWESLSNRNARFRSTVIGTLLTDLAEGKDFDVAVKSFETKVAPMNYKRPTSVITQKMVENAIEKLNDLGLGGAIYRRYAKLSDVSVNDVLFVDNKSKSKMKGGIEELLQNSIKKSTPDIKKAVAITSDKFLSDVLPNAKSLEVFVENRHTGNFVSLTAPRENDETPIFKWPKPFGWSYEGEVTDSVKQRVKAAGGNVNAKLRVSLSWFNKDDLDLHAITPSGNHIYYYQKQGILDVDMNAGAASSRTPVENLAFNVLENGVYKIKVHQFTQRETIDFGFSIEVEFNGIINQYSHPKAVRSKDEIKCLELTVKNGQLIDIKTNLVGGNASQEKWGIKTETLVPVVAVMNSPNHWGDSKVGAKHVIFSLENCKNPLPTRGIYNEFLRGDLDQHRKVFEVLGAKTKCPYSDEQISGVGFTSARGDSVTVVVDGKRSYNVSF